MDTGYIFGINDCEITYTSILEDGFMPVEGEE